MTELTRVLQRQHQDLQESMTHLPALQGAARCDVFLHVRRRLAVHQAFEELVVLPRLGAEPDGAPAQLLTVERDVLVAEQMPIDSPEFDAALGRVVGAHLHHTRRQEAELFPRLREPLTAEESALVITAAQLWLGGGDAYLGNTYAQMVLASRHQLANAAEAPPPVSPS
jgi:hypothetical protein